MSPRTCPSLSRRRFRLSTQMSRMACPRRLHGLEDLTFTACSAPPLSALQVQVSAVQIVDDDHGKLLDYETPYCLRVKILVGNDLSLFDALGEERRRSLDRPEVHAPVLLHRFSYLFGA